MLCRNTASIKGRLQLRYIQPEESHDEREEHCREQVPVLREFVEERWVLEDAETACAERQQREPLHHDKINKVHAGGFVETGIVEVLIDVCRHGAVTEPEVAEGDPIALEIPIRHGKRGYSFKHADEAVRLHHELPVDEPVYPGFAGPAEQDVCFWSFISEDSRGGTICEATYALSGFASGVWR